MADPLVQAPDLPELTPERLADGDLDVSGALVQGGSVRTGRVRIIESELRGVTIEAPAAPGLTLIHVVLRDCGLSNIDGREGVIRRVSALRCRLVGLDVNASDISDLSVGDSSLELASFAGARLRNVSFVGVNLTEASFQEARLEGVEFIDCELAGADFRRARLSGAAIRGAALTDVIGVESLRGMRMPWSDVVASAGALATALGIEIEE
ncbi:MAG TPA: pentapeptide repeat-containing protein [Solirubrobacteraceae bacterium]|nr:pentapeptide repeat-containing protein [Solirubrobacteraceae bacterium]